MAAGPGDTEVAVAWAVPAPMEHQWGCHWDQERREGTQVHFRVVALKNPWSWFSLWLCRTCLRGRFGKPKWAELFTWDLARLGEVTPLLFKVMA